MERKERGTAEVSPVLWVVLAALTAWGLSWQISSFGTPESLPTSPIALERFVLAAGFLSACMNVLAWPLLAGLLQGAVFLFADKLVSGTEARRVMGWTYCPFFLAASIAMFMCGIHPPTSAEDLRFLSVLRMVCLGAGAVIVARECLHRWNLSWFQTVKVLGAPLLIYWTALWGVERFFTF